jgi:hypothetical protein
MRVTEKALNGHIGRAQRDRRLQQKTTLRHAQSAAHQLDAHFRMDNIGERSRGEAITPIIEDGWEKGQVRRPCRLGCPTAQMPA